MRQNPNKAQAVPDFGAQGEYGMSKKLAVNSNGIPMQNIIYTFRGVQIVLDRDLANLYNIENRALKQAVKRNPARFPDDFMFELSDNEIESLVSQNVIPSFGASLKDLGKKWFAFSKMDIGAAEMLGKVEELANVTK
jgi:hypothetical protein